MFYLFYIFIIYLYLAEDFPIWIISDMRRQSDLKWFEESFPDTILTVRVVASEETRAQRGWIFTKGQWFYLIINK